MTCYIFNNTKLQCWHFLLGTLSAIFVTFLTYITYGVMIGACYLSEASGIESEYQAYLTGNTSVLFFNDCSNRTCDFGSSNDQQVTIFSLV